MTSLGLLLLWMHHASSSCVWERQACRLLHVCSLAQSLVSTSYP